MIYAETIDIPMRRNLLGTQGFFSADPKCTIFHSQSFNKFFSYEFQLARLKVAKMSYVK